jgi:hypothetical protein
MYSNKAYNIKPMEVRVRDDSLGIEDTYKDG